VRPDACPPDSSVSPLMSSGLTTPCPIYRTRRRRRGPRSRDARIKRALDRFTSQHQQMSVLTTCSSSSCSVDNIPLSSPCEAGQILNALVLLQCNIRGWISHKDELYGHIGLMEHRPSLVLLNETLWDASLQQPCLPNYELSGRHEKAATRRGVALFSRNEISPDVVFLEKSEVTERMWFYVHSQIGCVLLCVWYRRPCRGEVDSIVALRSEYGKWKHEAIGTIIMGDLNVHQQRWLTFSSDNSPEGDCLQNFCADYGFTERVRAPTRGDYILDLLLTDLHVDIRVQVLPGVSDHSMVKAIFDMSIPVKVPIPRSVWLFREADWQGMRASLADHIWPWNDDTSPDDAAGEFQSHILALMDEYIPSKLVMHYSSEHPWFNDHCYEAVRRKYAAWGTPRQSEESIQCSHVLFQQYLSHVGATKEKLRTMKRGSKAWWKLSKTLLHKTTTAISIPALRVVDGSWARSSLDKANLLAETFQKQWTLPDPVENEYSALGVADEVPDDLVPIRARHVGRFLSKLAEHSATGPDGVPSRVLKNLHAVLAVPFAKLARCIVNHGCWPSIWTFHWICALHKKRSMFDPKNYRGLQLTAQISKAMERFLASLFLPDLILLGAFGDRQFAYRPQHGARDAILLLIISWLLAFSLGYRVGVYCSDVSGAFDKVRAQRLIAKLKVWGMHPRLLSVIESWLKPRRAQVVVSGQKSSEFVMQDMVYQGTVWGPSLWNVFFSDSAVPLRRLAFKDVYYADDLNAFKAFHNSISDDIILDELNTAQNELHTWGSANQVSFDAGKESFHVLSRTRPVGNSFVILGITFDGKLLMHTTVHDCVTACGWKLDSVLRTRRFFCDYDLVLFFKSHILSFVEYRTPGIYHAAASVLKPLDNVLDRFLRQLSVSSIDSLVHFGLAPLETRRDIAMLGVIHRTVIGAGPTHFKDFFCLDTSLPTRYVRHRHSKHLLDPCLGGRCPNYLSKSILGLIAVYNLLPDYVVKASSVKLFQTNLSDLVKYLAVTGYEEWKSCLNRRSIARSVLPRITREAVRQRGALLPVRRLCSSEARG
jgi:hypothetical protein